MQSPLLFLFFVLKLLKTKLEEHEDGRSVTYSSRTVVTGDIEFFSDTLFLKRHKKGKMT